VLEDIELANATGVGSTPTILVNGRPLNYWSVAEFTQGVIREELNR
jgi:protein-disulfide isomerase